MVQNRPQPCFALPERLLGQLSFGDVEDEDAESRHVARGVDVRLILGIHPARPAGIGRLELEGDTLAPERLVDVSPGSLHRFGSQYFVDRPARQLGNRAPKPGLVQSVDEQVPAISPHVGDERGHRVGHVPQLLLARAEGRLPPRELPARGGQPARPKRHCDERGQAHHDPGEPRDG